MARVSSKLHHDQEAEGLFRKAADIGGLNKRSSLNDYEAILENYAEFLESVHQPARAAQMYERVRALT